jgi:HSP20 family molecular chaperone IbpA
MSQRSQQSQQSPRRSQTEEPSPERSGDHGSQTSSGSSEVSGQYTGISGLHGVLVSESISLPYGPAQQVMLARRTKALDMALENALRERVLQLALQLDHIDLQHLSEIFQHIKSFSPAIYQALVEPGPYARLFPQVPIVELHANAQDFLLDHSQLLQCIIARGDEQRAALLADVIKRLNILRQTLGLYPGSQLDPQQVDILIFELQDKIKLMNADDISAKKIELVGQCKSSLLEMKRCRTVSKHALQLSWPQVDLIDLGERIKMVAHVPGFKKERINIDVASKGKTVVLSGEQEKQERPGKFVQRETTSTGFRRTVQLPWRIDTKDVRAEFNDGVLEVTFRKLDWKKVNVE